jgi:hypothetical protein
LGTWTFTATQYYLRMAGRTGAVGIILELPRVSSRAHGRSKPVQVPLDQFAILVADAGRIENLLKTSC